MDRWQCINIQSHNHTQPRTATHTQPHSGAQPPHTATTHSHHVQPYTATPHSYHTATTHNHQTATTQPPHTATTHSHCTPPYTATTHIPAWQLSMSVADRQTSHPGPRRSSRCDGVQAQHQRLQARPQLRQEHQHRQRLLRRHSQCLTAASAWLSPRRCSSYPVRICASAATVPRPIFSVVEKRALCAGPSSSGTTRLFLDDQLVLLPRMLASALAVSLLSDLG